MVSKAWMLAAIALFLMMQLGFFQLYLHRRHSVTDTTSVIIPNRQPHRHHLLPSGGVASLENARFSGKQLPRGEEASRFSGSMSRRRTKQGTPLNSTLAAKYLKTSRRVVVPSQPSHITKAAQRDTASTASHPVLATSSHSREVSKKHKTVTQQTVKGTHSQPTLHPNASHRTMPTKLTQGHLNWEKNTFCHDFFVNTFIMKAEVCANSSIQKSVVCYGNRRSSSMATCTLKNIIVSPKLLGKAMSDADYLKFASTERSVALLKGAGTDCVNTTTSSLSKRVEKGDYVLHMAKKLEEEEKQDASDCDTWIHETVFFFTAHRFHIYFRFLDYFNIHRLLEDAVLKFNVSQIIRISGNDNYHFGWFDQALFPEVQFQTLANLTSEKTCFEKVVLVPKSYASPVFQCKNRAWLRTTCKDCNGRGRNETHLNSFRTRVLKACSHRVDSMNAKKNGSLIVLVSRSPYLRNSKDRLGNFERVLENENQLVTSLRGNFSSSTVHVVHLEQLDICEQVAYAHCADVYLGVHGSGLVHLWWMRDEALVYEMEPHYEVANPTFRMLSRLAGRNYHSEFITGGWKIVKPNITDVIRNLKKFSRL